MKFVNDATAKDTAFIKCFPDDSGVYARVLTETELDTRYIIPHCVHSAIVVTMNARKLYRVFFPLRCCARAQWEIRDLAQAMLVLCKKEFPAVFDQAGASCKILGYCSEGQNLRSSAMPVALTQERIRVHDAIMDYVGKTSLSASKAIAWQRCAKGAAEFRISVQDS